MRKSTRILSFMMALVIAMSALSIIAQGRASYVDTYLTNYDDLDNPVITFDQACTMVLDSVDVMLAKENMVIDLSILGSIRLTSLNNAMSDISGLVNGLTFTLFSWMLGDLSSLNVDAITSPRRTTSQDTTDTTVLYALVQFLNDNKTIIGKLIDGSISLGVASSAFDPADLNLNQMVKGMLYGAAYPDATVPETVTDNADTMVQKIITDLFQGKLDSETGKYDGLAPELVPYIDIVNTTSPAYDFVGTLLQQAWNLIVVPLLNTDLKKTVREACGVVYDPLLETDPLYQGDASNLNEYAQILNIDYVIPAYTVPAGSTFIAELNNILAGVVNELTVSYTWSAGANTNLLANLSAAAKYILNQTGSALFPEYLDVASSAEVNAMNDQQLFSYILRSLLNTGTASLYIPADADTLAEVVWYAVRDELADKLPAIDYSAQPKTQAGILYMLADLIAYTLNQTADMNTAAGTTPGSGLVAYGQGLNATLLAATNWARTNYGSLFSSSFSATDPWAAIDTLAFTILLQANWFPASVNGSSYELLINRIFAGVLNLDVTGILSLLARRSDSELATKTIKQILIDTVTRVVNNIFPGAVGSFTSFDTIITNANLAVIIKNILTQLNTRKTAIMPAIIPLLAESMEKSTPQAYQDPDIQLPNVVGAATTFAIRNDSTGINTGATDKNGNFVRDNLYKISIVSVTSSIPAITVTNLAGTVINGGDEVSCALGGTFTADQQLMITVTYNVLTETGTVLTPVPLSQRAFAYISTVTDDGDGKTWITVDGGTGNYHKMKYINSYFNYPAAPEAPEVPGAGATQAEIDAYNTAYAKWQQEMVQYPIDKNASMQELKNPVSQIIRDPNPTLGLHTTAATVSRGTATVNATLAANGISAAPFTNISTTKDGGGWNPKYFAVSASPTRPADGLYASNFVFTATKSQFFGSSESYTIPYKVVLYTDYDLPSLLQSAIEANRDPNNYSDSAAYSNYITAVKNAVSICYRPRSASTFMTTHAPYFQPYATALKNAIKTLEESALSAGVEPLRTAMDAVAPPNEDIDYDNPAYNYFGPEDYVLYTYNRYSDVRDDASSIWGSQQLAEEPEAPAAGATQAEIDAYNTAYAKWQIDYAAAAEALSPVKAVSVSYALHRFNLYAGRLVRVQAVKDRLNEAVAFVNANMPVETACTKASWAEFDRAYDFAVAANAESAAAVNGSGEFILRQTKVNEARENLIETWKQIVPIADYMQLLAYITQAQALVQAAYTPESWSNLAASLNSALAVPLEMTANEANQAVIDAAAAALRTAIELLQAIQIEANQVGVTIDEEKSFIYGIDLNAGVQGCIQPSEGGSLVFHYTPAGPGTGTTVDLMNGSTLIMTYNIVVFGDVNGSSNINPLDALMILRNCSGRLTFNGVQTFAADLDTGGTITPIDALMVLQSSAGIISISQVR